GPRRYRRGDQDRRDGVQRRAARLARRGPHTATLARVPDADALDRSGNQEEGRRAAALRGAPQARDGGPVRLDRASPDHARDGESRAGDLHMRTKLEKMQTQYKLEVATKPPKIPY